MNEVRSTGPYIFTTTRERSSGTEFVSRRAVATLDEAQNYILLTVNAAQERSQQPLPGERRQALYLSEQGGTVGPLPNGTVIEVVATDWIELSRNIPASHLPKRTIPTAEDRNEPGLTTGPAAREALLAAYNEAQET